MEEIKTTKDYGYVDIFLDIETIPSPEKPSLDDIEAPANYKDLDKIQKYKEDSQMREWAKQALHPLKGRIFCIGYAVDDEPPDVIYSTDEKEMIEQVTSLLMGHSHFRLIGHNIIDFDAQFLFCRAVKYGSALRELIMYSKGDVKDTIKMFAGISYDKTNRYSLKDIASFLGIPCKSEMDGSMVFDYYRNGRFDEIKEYCKEDINVVREVYYKLIGRDRI